MPESRSRKKPKSSYTPPPSASGPKTSPQWLVPTMLTLMIVGLVWVVVTYISRFAYPLPIGGWNLAVGFTFMIAGFALTTRWH